MSALSDHACRPYGAFELKATYQRNLLFGLLADVLLAAAIIGGVFLYREIASEETQSFTPASKTITISKVGPPPTIIKKPPQIDIGAASKALPKFGIPKPVADYEVEDRQMVIASRDELRDILPPSMESGSGDTELIVIADTVIDKEDPLPFTPVEVDADIIYAAEPEYPRLARQAGMEGVVWVAVYVDENGDVADARIYKSSGSNAGFDEAALKAARKCKFKPAIQNGQPVKEWVTYKFVFNLRDADI